MPTFWWHKRYRNLCDVVRIDASMNVLKITYTLDVLTTECWYFSIRFDDWTLFTYLQKKVKICEDARRYDDPCSKLWNEILKLIFKRVLRLCKPEYIIGRWKFQPVQLTVCINYCAFKVNSKQFLFSVMFVLSGTICETCVCQLLIFCFWKLINEKINVCVEWMNVKAIFDACWNK